MKPKALALIAVVIISAVAGWLIVSQKPLAPAIAVADLKGGQVNLGALRGKVVLVNFWATTCTTCVGEMPAMTETWKRFSPQGYEMVAVAMDYDPADQVKAFVAKTGLPFTVALDSKGDAAKAFGGVRLTPTSFLIDRKGHIIQEYLGQPDMAQFHAEIEALLKQPA